MTIDWEQHRIKPASCVFEPRPTYRGRPLRPDHEALRGTRLELVAMWLMDEDDPYPGEYALSSPDSCRSLVEAFGVGWVASGDVRPNA